MIIVNIATKIGGSLYPIYIFYTSASKLPLGIISVDVQG